MRLLTGLFCRSVEMASGLEDGDGDGGGDGDAGGGGSPRRTPAKGKVKKDADGDARSVHLLKRLGPLLERFQADVSSPPPPPPLPPVHTNAPSARFFAPLAMRPVL